MGLYDSAVPGAPAYLAANNAAKLAYSNALASLNQKRMGFLRNAGYQADFDQNTGVAQNIRVDPNNPYGSYQENRRNHAGAAEGFTDELNARGLHGGLAEQLKKKMKLDFGRDDNTLGQNMLSGLEGFQQDQNNAKYNYDNTLWQNEYLNTGNAIDNSNFNPADTTPATEVNHAGNYFDNAAPDPWAGTNSGNPTGAQSAADTANWGFNSPAASQIKVLQTSEGTFDLVNGQWIKRDEPKKAAPASDVLSRYMKNRGV